MELLKNPVLLMDGAMGTMLTSILPSKLSNLDEASVLYPEIVERIHREYAEAGADIIKTNTFNNSNFTKEAVALARKTGKLVAGVMGPVFYETKLEAIIESMSKAGVDLLLLETMTSLKDTIAFIEIIKKNSSLPLMVSMTLTRDGKALSGETPSEFLKAIAGLNLFSFGFNCSFGTPAISNALRELENPHRILISAHPNLGLPGALESDEDFAREMSLWISAKKVNIIGGCCGTTPDHIKKLRTLIP